MKKGRKACLAVQISFANPREVLKWEGHAVPLGAILFDLAQAFPGAL